MDYIRTLNKGGYEHCFLCDSENINKPSDLDHLLLWKSEHSQVLINRYPYANGHLLVAPRAHKGDMIELSAAEHLDLSVQSTRAMQLLRRAVSAQGFNVGINLGRVAGAGVPKHLHQHVVPRWGGDLNFMTVVGETRVVPQAISQLFEELMRLLPELQAEWAAHPIV